MTARRGSKSRKLRGVRQHGFGKTHRGAGHRGGRGNAGSGKKADQKKPEFWKKKYFGKDGFKKLNSKKIVKKINLGDLQKKMDCFIGKGFAKKENDFIFVDLKKAGYDKLLGVGNVFLKLNILVSSASKGAVEKVQKAEGKIVLE
jgi:large subunit ribosomal protein L15